MRLPYDKTLSAVKTEPGLNPRTNLSKGRGLGFEAVVPNPKLKLMDQVRERMRLRHYSMHTKRSYCDWILRFIRFHQMKSRADLEDAETKIEAFLSHLAVNGRVAVATQNQAFNALLLLLTIKARSSGLQP